MLHYLDAKDFSKPAKLPEIVVENLSRRSFLIGTGAAFTLAATLGSAEAFPRWPHGGESMPHGVRPDPMIFVRIAEDGTVTLVAHRSEMGTGSRTSIPMIMADEMEADWSRVVIEQAEADEPKYGNQDTDGSRSLRHHIQMARQVGASVRHMLQTAAAEKWDVPASEIKVENHVVSHGANKAGFGELASAAMALPVPPFEDLSFKNPNTFRYIGKGKVQITDLHDITTGKAIYGADVSLPGMLTAVIARPPAMDGVVKSFDASGALEVPGVVKVLEVKGTPQPAKFAPLGGIAILATNTQAAIDGREALEVEWDTGKHGSYDSEKHLAEMVATADKPGKVLRDQGNVDEAFTEAAKVVEHTYTQAYMAHAPMEPPVAVANVTADGAEIWGPFQSPYVCRTDIAEALGMDPSKVRVNVTLLGGGFGRKSQHDFGIEAALLSRDAGVPVRVQWTREDDIQHSFMHTMSAEKVSVAIDKDGKVSGWKHNSVAPSILSIFAPDSGHQFFIETGMGHADMPFQIPNVRCENGASTAHTRIAWFRAVSNVPRAWAIGSFVSELAAELGKDEKQMWLELIGAPRIVNPKAEGYPDDYWNYGEPYEGFAIETDRLAHVLDMAADRIGYGKDLPEGEGIGLAVHRSFVSYVGCAVRVKIVDGTIRVPEVHLAVDAGYIANPERVESQMQGAAVMGMTLALHSGITFSDGEVEQSNYHDYEMVRADNFPEKVYVHTVPHGFSKPATGIGEPGVPPVAPAIANAVFHATGKRNRHLPMGTTV